MTKDDARELLELIEEYAPKLQRAGVLGTVKLEGVEFNIVQLAGEERTDEDDDEESDDPLDDPRTFGYRKGKNIPGARKPA